MGYTTELEAMSPEGLMRPDIVITALPDGTSCSIAVEFDGLSHYVSEQYSSDEAVDRLNGRTQLRNALLSRSFPDGLLVIPWKEWAAAKGNGQAQQCLKQALAQLLQQQVSALQNAQDTVENRGLNMNAARSSPNSVAS
jgi:response regulator RpfG family c-di-GMP phosphodiesterase